MRPNVEKQGKHNGQSWGPGFIWSISEAGHSHWPPLLKRSLCSGHSMVNPPPGLITLFRLKGSIALLWPPLPIIPWELASPCAGSVHIYRRKEWIIMHFNSLVGRISLCPGFQSTLYVKIHLLREEDFSSCECQEESGPTQSLLLPIPRCPCYRLQGPGGNAF